MESQTSHQLPVGLECLCESWEDGQGVAADTSYASPVELHSPIILTSGVERHPVLTLYPGMELLAYGGTLYWFCLPRSFGKSPWQYRCEGSRPTFSEVVSRTKTVALAHRLECIENKYMAGPRHPLFAGGYQEPMQLSVFLCQDSVCVYHDDAPFLRGLWLDFERRYFAHYLLCRLQQRVRRWLRHRQVMRIGVCALVHGSQADSAQRAVFSTRELLELVLRHAAGPRFRLHL